MRRSDLTWVLEPDVFSHGDSLSDAARRAGFLAVQWADEWWETQSWPRFAGPAVFHGSLANADRIRRELPWRPGAYCSTDRFHCSAWYPAAREWLVHERWEVLSASAFVAQSEQVLDRLGHGVAVFVRPDGPLKAFSGRVVPRGEISLASLDFGFYFDDPELPVIVAPVRSIQQEWRFVVVKGAVVAGSGYVAARRQAVAMRPDASAWRFAEDVATRLPAPEAVYVLDVCQCDGELRLLELNPFSGADLYACNLDAVVASVGAATAHSDQIETPRAAGS
ncbi:MAG TPA: ATP-grasp domain-containing protein [Pirellulales bacterium]